LSKLNPRIHKVLRNLSQESKGNLILDVINKHCYSTLKNYGYALMVHYTYPHQKNNVLQHISGRDLYIALLACKNNKPPGEDRLNIELLNMLAKVLN
jgi:hypothetical protein